MKQGDTKNQRFSQEGGGALLQVLDLLGQFTDKLLPWGFVLRIF